MWRSWITLTVPGVPEAKPRARATRRGAHIGMYQPSTPKDWAGAVRAVARDQVPTEPTLLPVRVDIAFYMKRPKAHFGTGRNAGKLKATAPRWHTTKPDRDNLDKAILDILTELGYWRDDCQVVCGLLTKSYPEDGWMPHAWIGITLWEPENA